MRITGSRIRVVLLIVSLVYSLPVGGTTFQLYYLGGQSNMDGYGFVNELPSALQGPVEGVMIFHGNTSPDGAQIDGRGLWAELRAGHGVGFTCDGSTNTYSDRFGVELTFARRLLELQGDAHIALIKYSRGGTSIDAAAAGGFGCWDPDYNTGNGVNQYDHFLATVRHALAVDDIDQDGEPDVLVPAGIVWMQGESDANAEDVARRYESNLKRLMELIRAAFRVDDLPVVIGRISDSGQDDDGNVWDFGPIVRQAQARFVRNDGYAALVTTTDGYAYSDKWHYDTAGYIDLGEQFAQAFCTAGQYTPTSGYARQTIEGWDVLVNKELAEEHPDLAARTLELLRFQLYQITRVVASEPLRQLQSVPIWVEYSAPRHPCMCYHPSRDWLRENGFNPEKQGSVEIANAENFLTWTIGQPWMVLHELAHAYHHQVMGYDHAELKGAYESMKAGGQYESVLHISGHMRRAYALNNDQEYFAECTEAFFGTNDFYPFVRSELQRHDPDMYELLRKLWDVK